MTPKEKNEFQKRIKLCRATGLVRGLLYIEDMEEFSKKGLIEGLEEVEKLLTEISESDDK